MIRAAQLREWAAATVCSVVCSMGLAFVCEYSIAFYPHNDTMAWDKILEAALKTVPAIAAVAGLAWPMLALYARRHGGVTLGDVCFTMLATLACGLMSMRLLCDTSNGAQLAMGTIPAPPFVMAVLVRQIRRGLNALLSAQPWLLKLSWKYFAAGVCSFVVGGGIAIIQGMAAFRETSPQMAFVAAAPLGAGIGFFVGTSLFCFPFNGHLQLHEASRIVAIVTISGVIAGTIFLWGSAFITPFIAIGVSLAYSQDAQPEST